MPNDLIADSCILGDKEWFILRPTMPNLIMRASRNKFSKKTAQKAI
jgi:hypothetical protein